MTVQAWPSDPHVDESVAVGCGLSSAEWQRAVAALGRLPTYAEVGVIASMWSEHCSYKSSRLHLRRLPTEGRRVVQGPGENAGAVDIGDGFCAVFKMESHNHPSFIEPYQGAATGVGGILRDVFTMGARPVALLNALRFGRPDHPQTARLLRGVVAGIGAYGNCMGVPTVGGELQFDASYDGNILVNAFALGIARRDELFFGRASGIGNAVLYVGSRTGRDGVHGATMSSVGFGVGGDTASKLPTVQVGDPFLEKLLLEACLEIFALGCLEGVQDMGAAGLTSSAVEMAARAGNGIELDLDAVPRRSAGLTPYELLLSESQERMLMVAKAGREAEVLEVCRKWDLQAAVIGRVIEGGRLLCRATAKAGEAAGIVVDLPIDLLAEQAPCYDRPQQAPASIAASPLETLPSIDAGAELLALLKSPNIGSRAWIWRQFDRIVGLGTVLGPGESDAAVLRVFCEDASRTHEKFLAIAVDCPSRMVGLDPYLGAAMAVAECSRNIVCSGAEPLGLTDCLNFGSPQHPPTMWSIAQAIDGLAAACRALDVPVVSGNVSLYNETDGQAILPTPMVAIVGQLAAPEHRLGLAFRHAGDRLALLGTAVPTTLGGSEWWASRRSLNVPSTVAAPQLDLELEKRLQSTVLTLARRGLLQSAHDVSDGGMAVCLAESCIAGNLGAQVAIPGVEHQQAAVLLFAEDPSRIVVSYLAADEAEVFDVCQQADLPCTPLGEVMGDRLQVHGLLDAPIHEMKHAQQNALASIVGE